MVSEVNDGMQLCDHGEANFCELLKNQPKECSFLLWVL